MYLHTLLEVFFGFFIGCVLCWFCIFKVTGKISASGTVFSPFCVADAVLQAPLRSS